LGEWGAAALSGDYTTSHAAEGGGAPRNKGGVLDPELADPRVQLLAHREPAQKRGGLLELLHHCIDGALAVAAHDAVECVKEMLLDRLPRRVADELLGNGADARGEVDQVAVFLVGAVFRFFF